MKCHRIFNTALLLMVSAIGLVSMSCQNKPTDNSSGSVAAYTEYSVDISKDNAPPQTISKRRDQRIVWVNNSDGPLYVCIDPASDPFEAYGWYVPGKGDKRKAGKIVDGLNPAPGTGQSFTFNPSPNACPGTNSGPTPYSTPKIIIVQQ